MSDDIFHHDMARFSLKWDTYINFQGFFDIVSYSQYITFLL